jgi:hypothetical protein
MAWCREAFPKHSSKFLIAHASVTASTYRIQLPKAGDVVKI